MAEEADARDLGSEEAAAVLSAASWYEPTEEDAAADACSPIRNAVEAGGRSGARGPRSDPGMLWVAECANCRGWIPEIRRIAIRWMQDWRESGRDKAQRQGGDRRSQRAEAYKDIVLAAVDAKVDITLVELAEMLRRDHGFPRGDFSDSGSVLVKEAGMDGSSLIA
ncbi:hypothetical protein [Teichococcus aerofrigidensis]